MTDTIVHEAVPKEGGRIRMGGDLARGELQLRNISKVISSHTYVKNRHTWPLQQYLYASLDEKAKLASNRR